MKRRYVRDRQRAKYRRHCLSLNLRGSDVALVSGHELRAILMMVRRSGGWS